MQTNIEQLNTFLSEMNVNIYDKMFACITLLFYV